MRSVLLLRLAREDGRLGAKLTRTTVDCAATECRPSPIARPRPNGSVTVHYQSRGVSSAELATWLVPYVGRAVIDRTGLTGDFDIDLAFDLSALTAATPAEESVSVFAALSEQLGLKLEAVRGPAEVLVIDSAEMPTPD